MSRIDNPDRGPLTQGAIFSGAVAENYSGCEVWGLVITARCDVANDKVRVWNYLPVVRLNDWLHRDGRTILAERIYSDQLGKLKSALKEGKYSFSILESEAPRKVVETLFSGSEAKQKKKREQLEAVCARLDVASVAISASADDYHCLMLAELEPRAKDTMLSELVGHRLAGYYFLEQIEVGADDLGYVVLLREARHIPRELAAAISEGLDEVAYKLHCQTRADATGQLSLEKLGYAMPVGKLRSPGVEHLMQTFSLLFSRIGVADTSGDYLEKLWQRQPSVAAKGAL